MFACFAVVARFRGYRNVREACRKNFHRVAPLKTSVARFYDQKNKKVHDYLHHDYQSLSVRRFKSCPESCDSTCSQFAWHLSETYSRNIPKPPPNHSKPYAHMLIAVAFLVVNFFSFLVIAPSHQLQSARKWVEMLPTSLPDLPRPTRTRISSSRP